MSAPVPMATAKHIESRLGDPWASGHAFSFDRILEADEADRPVDEAEAMLDALEVPASFVPTELGGRLGSLEDLVDALRAVYRRDPGLALGYAGGSMIAAFNVWAGGSPEQKARVANLLLEHRKLACAFHELTVGNDILGTTLSAEPRESGWTLRGRKDVVSNLRRAEAVLFFARSSAAPGSRSHTQLLWFKGDHHSSNVAYGPRYGTAGMRAVALDGARFDDLALPDDAAVGGAGRGLEIALKAFQITRTVIPGMFLGVLDTALHVTTRWATSRRLYGQRVIDLPKTRAILSGAFIDLLIADCFCRVGARALHLLPSEGLIYSAAIKGFVPATLLQAMDALCVVMGSRFYLRGGPFGIFQKLLRDAAPASFGHASKVACQLTLLPFLPRIAARPVHEGPVPPAALFGAAGDLPALDPAALKLNPRSHRLLGAFAASLADGVAAPGSLRLILGAYDEARLNLEGRLAELSPQDLGPDAPCAAHDLVEQYMAQLAAASCVGTWRHATAPFLADPQWLIAALRRLAPRAGVRIGRPIADLHETIFSELERRTEARLALDCTASPIFRRALTAEEGL